MEYIAIIAPIKKPEDIESFIPHTLCRDFYVYHHKFFNNYDYIQKFINTAHSNNCRIYVNFKHSITEEDLIKEINNLGKDAIHIKEHNDVVNYLKNNVKNNDLILTLGAGNVTKIATLLVK